VAAQHVFHSRRHCIGNRAARIDEGAGEVEDHGSHRQRCMCRISRLAHHRRAPFPRPRAWNRGHRLEQGARSSMSIALQTHTLTTRQGLPLRVDLRIMEGMTPLAGVMVCHGFKGFKDWGFFPWISERLAEAGLAVATLDFSMNGIGDQPGEFTRLDQFEANTYSQELSDLGQVMGWLVMDSPVSGPLDGGRLGVLGHSRGALAAVVAAAENPGGDVEWCQSCVALQRPAVGSVGTGRSHGVPEHADQADDGGGMGAGA
jgi:hypothetical protein